MADDEQRWIAHVDMDAFYVSVELLRRPELRGKPVVVATGTDPTARGVVMAASYEAREFGVHSALPLAVAHRRCPQAVLVPRDMERYRELSTQVMEILRDNSDEIEILGLDEAYLDLTGSPVPKTRCRRIKHRVKEELGLVCSIGLGPNKLIAKVASDLNKPDGFCVIDAEQWLDRVGDRPASLIPGIGPKTERRLGRLGIKTVGQLAATPAEALQNSLGPRLGGSLKNRALGLDERPVSNERERKSESRETTFPENVSSRDILNAALERLVDQLSASLARHERRGRTITLKIRLEPFRTYTRSRTIETSTNDRATIGSTAQAMLDEFPIDAPVRLIGVGVSALESESEPLRLSVDE